VIRLVALCTVVSALAAAAGSTPAPAAPGMLKGIYDEAQTLYGNPDRTFPILGQLRTKLLRVNLYWGGEFGVATGRRPANPRDPDDRAYDWAIYDRTARYAQQYGIRLVFSVWGTPGWANRFRGLRSAPVNATDLQNFVFAAARRYGGRWIDEDGRGVPRVDHWLAWNEPNNPAFLSPQYRVVRGKAVIWSAREYAKICNAVVRGVKAVRVRSQKVACGVTGPRGNNNPRSVRASVSPLAFLRAMKAAGAKGFDAYAHHPYYGRPVETPTTRPRAKSTAIVLGNIDVLLKELSRRYGRKPLWITEYGYQTNPPDRTFGVSNRNQARYMAQAYAIAKRNPRIQMFLWFLLRDEPRLGGWQSGLYTASGRKKPAFNTFRSLR
jgi:hypothetical protein